MHRGTFFFPEALRLEPARTLRCHRNASVRSMPTFCVAKGAWASQPHCLPIGPVNSSWPACLRMSCQLGGQTWREIAWRDRQQHFDTLFRRLHRIRHHTFPQTGGLKGYGHRHLLRKQCANSLHTATQHYTMKQGFIFFPLASFASRGLNSAGKLKTLLLNATHSWIQQLLHFWQMLSL